MTNVSVRSLLNALETVVADSCKLGYDKEHAEGDYYIHAYHSSPCHRQFGTLMELGVLGPGRVVAHDQYKVNVRPGGNAVKHPITVYPVDMVRAGVYMDVLGEVLRNGTRVRSIWDLLNFSA